MAGNRTCTDKVSNLRKHKEENIKQILPSLIDHSIGIESWKQGSRGFSLVPDLGTPSDHWTVGGNERRG